MVIGASALIALKMISRETIDVDCLDPKIPTEILLAAAEFDYRATADVFQTDLSYSLLVGITLALQDKVDEAVLLCRSVLQDEPPLETLLRERAAAYPALKPLLERLGL